MHYSLNKILSKKDLKYLINYYNSREHYVTRGMEKLLIPFADKDFISVIDNIIQNKIGIKDKYKIVGDNFYKHVHSYFPHCDAVNKRAWLNIVIPLERYVVFGRQKFIVFDQRWSGSTTTWMGKIQRTEEFESNKKTNQRPVDSEFFTDGTSKMIPKQLWQHLDNDELYDRDYFYSMSGKAYNWVPGNIIVFDSQHIHATGKMKSAQKLGLSIRIERI